MKKRGIIFFLSFFLIDFVSAFSNYNRFSLSGFLDSIDPSTMILGVLFIISFALINTTLGKVFKNDYGEPNKAIAGIIAFAVSILIIYEINRYGLDIEGLFYSVGFSSDLLYVILPIILLVGAIFIIIRYKKFGFAVLSLILGLLLMILTVFTDIFYEKGLALIIGIVLLLIGLLLWNRARRSLTVLGGGIGRAYSKGRRIYGDTREYVDPRSRLERREIRRAESRDKGRAKSELMRQKTHDKELKRRYIRRHGKAAWYRRKTGF